MIVLHCPNCNKKLGIGDALAGRSAVCPHCKTKFAVPEPDDEGIGLGGTPVIGGGASDPKAIAVEGHRLLIADLAVIPCKASMLEVRALKQATTALRHAREIRHNRPPAIIVLRTSIPRSI